MAEYKGYTGKAKTSAVDDFFKAYESGATGRANKAAEDDEKKQRKEAAKRLEEQYKKEGKNADGTNKSLTDQIAGIAGAIGTGGLDLGSRVIGGIQQSAANVADTALMGGNLLEDTAAGIRGDTPEERAKINKRYESVRSEIKKGKTVRGDSLNEREDYKPTGDLTRDIADLAGRGINTALDATMFANPTQLALNGGKQAARVIARDAATFGGLDALATGSETYGRTGDAKEALARGGEAGITSALTQGALGTGGALIGKAADKLRPKAIDAPSEGIEAPRGLPQGKIDEEPQKRLGESTSEYEQRIAELDGEAERIRNGDYTGLTDPKRVNAGKKGTTVETQDPKLAQRQTEASRAADEAEQEIDRLNKMKLASPLHRQLDKINDAKQKEVDQLDQMEATGDFPPEAIAAAREDLDARYTPQVEAVTQKYLSNPRYAQDVMEAPVLEESLRNATQARMDAELEIQNAMSEEMNAVGKLGAADTIDTPDPQRIMGRLKEIDDEKASLQDQVGQAEYRRSTYGDLDKTTTELDDLNTGNFDQESRPDMFNEDGTQDVDARKARVRELRSQGAETQARTALIDEVPTGQKASKVAEENPVVKEALDTELNDVDSLLVDANPDYKPGIGAWASSTARVYEKAGIGGVLNKVRDGHDKMIKENTKLQEQLQTWWKDIGRDKAASENIGRYLNGESVSLSGETERVAKEMKAYYRKVADDLGLEPEQRITDYFPHIFSDKGMADQISELRRKLDDPELDGRSRAAAQKKYDKLFKQFVKTSDPDFQRILDKNPGANVNFGNLKSREYNQDGFSYDAFKVFDTYTRRANNKIFMEPGLEAMQAAQKEVSTKMADYLGKHMNLIKNNGAARSDLTEALDTSLQKAGFKPGSFERGSDIARTLVYNGTLGGNVGSAIRNSTQMTNTYALAGEKYVAIGQAQAIQALKNKAMQQELKDAGIFSDTLTQSLTENGDTFKTGTAKGAENAQKALWLMFNTTEKLNRAGAYYAGKNKALAAGKSAADAVQAGKEMARKTQFNSTVVDNPVGFSGPVAKNFLQLASYNIKQVEFIKDLVAGSDGFFKKQADGKYQLSGQGALNLARFVGGSAANLAILGPLVGLTATQMIPFLQEFGEGEVYQSPLVQILMGKDNSKTGLANIVSGKDKYGEDADRGKLIGDFIGDTAPTLLPGGVQAKKLLDSEKNNELGYSATDSGNIRFGVDPNNTADRIKGGVLGQYTTDPGREYIANMGNKDDEGNRTGGSLTKSASEKIKSAPANERPEMETFYRAAKTVTGRDTANTKITDLFSGGEPEKARRLAAEFNAKVDAKMAKYYSAYPDMDDDLLDELNGNLYIKLTPRSEKQRSK